MFLLLNLAAIITLAVVLVVRGMLRIWRIDSDWMRKEGFFVQLGIIVITYVGSLVLISRGEENAVIPMIVVMAIAWVFTALGFVDWLKVVMRRENENRRRVERFAVEHKVRPAPR